MFSHYTTLGLDNIGFLPPYPDGYIYGAPASLGRTAPDHATSAAGLVHADIDGLASGKRVPSRRDGGGYGLGHDLQRNLSRLDQGRATPGRRRRRELDHGFALPVQVADGDGHAAPAGGVGRPHRLSLHPPDLGLAIHFDLGLGPSLLLRHAQVLARQNEYRSPTLATLATSSCTEKKCT